MEAINNIIFDLGGLFIDVYMHRFEETLQQHLGRSPEVELLQMQQKGVFDAYEVGEMSSSVFLEELVRAFRGDCSAAQVEAAWNAILGQVQLKQLQAVQVLRTRFQVVLLSNTNDLHVDALEQEFAMRCPGERLSTYFDQVYYSQRIGKRKPNRDAFEHVLQLQQFKPEETLFIDDTAGHLAGAQAAGIHTLLHPRNADMEPTIAQIEQFAAGLAPSR